MPSVKPHRVFGEKRKEVFRSEGPSYIADTLLSRLNVRKMSSVKKYGHIEAASTRNQKPDERQIEK
jgi:hypothetical protein